MMNILFLQLKKKESKYLCKLFIYGKIFVNNINNDEIGLSDKLVFIDEKEPRIKKNEFIISFFLYTANFVNIICVAK